MCIETNEFTLETDNVKLLSRQQFNSFPSSVPCGHAYAMVSESMGLCGNAQASRILERKPQLFDKRISFIKAFSCTVKRLFLLSRDN